MFSFLSGFTDQVKLVVLAVAATLFLAMAGVAWYYKSSYESTLKDLATLQSEYAQQSTELQTCSDNIEKISKLSTEALVLAKQAANVASTEAKKNQTLATKILVAKPTGKDECSSALALFNQYITKSVK